MNCSLRNLFRLFFRRAGASQWSIEVPIIDNEAAFIHGQQKNTLTFHLGSNLTRNEQVFIEFHTLNCKKQRRKLIGFIEIILQDLLKRKHVHLLNEHLLDSNNRLLETQAEIKLDYFPFDERNDFSRQLSDWPTHSSAHGYQSSIVEQTIFFSLFSQSDDDRSSSREFKTNKYIRSRQDQLEDIDLLDNRLFQETFSKTSLTKFFSTSRHSLSRYEGNRHQIKDWQILLHVIRAEHLPGLEVNPFVKIEIGDQTRSTATQKSTNSPYFGEVGLLENEKQTTTFEHLSFQFFSFDFRRLSETRMMEQIIVFKVTVNHRIIQ